MRTALRSMGAAFVLGQVFACAGADPPAVGVEVEVVVKDSLGIEVVTSTGPTRALHIIPELVVGETDGAPELQFDRILKLAVDSLGGFWVADQDEGVRHFDAAGQYVGRVGARGPGPGEAGQYSGVWVGDGTVLASGAPYVVQLFASDGRLLESTTPRGENGQAVTPLGWSGDSWYLTYAVPTDEDRELFRRPTRVVSAGPTFTPLVAVGLFSGALRRRFGALEVGRASYFSGNPSIAVDGAGRLFVSDTLQYRVEVYGRTGEVTRVVQRATPARLYDPRWVGDIEVEVERSLGAPRAAMSEGGRTSPAGGPRTPDPAEVARIVEGATPVPEPTHLPFIDHLLVARDGSMWVRRADLHPAPAVKAAAYAFGWVRWAWQPEWVSPQVFDVFDTNGMYRGTVELPGEFEPAAILGDAVYGVLFDRLGVERVARYRVEPSSGN